MPSKVGLLNISDYYLSVSSNINCYNESSKCKTGWMHLSNNSDNINNNPYERIMTIYGFSENLGIYLGLNIYPEGWVSTPTLTGSYNIRPVIYINEDVFLMGTGTQSDPYRIISLDLN